MNAPMGSKKSRSALRSHSKTNKKIRKLFDKLRNESATSLDTTANNSVIILDSTIPSQINNESKLSEINISSNETIENTVVILDNTKTNPINNKRKLSDINVTSNSKVKFRKSQSHSDLIVIKDDDDLVTGTSKSNGLGTPRKNIISSPVHCSTPLEKTNSKVLKNSTSNVNNNTLTAQDLNQDINDLTREINRDSYLTIDLTTETKQNRTNRTDCTIIDLAETSSMHKSSWSMSGDSDVTVVKRNNENKVQKFAKGISRLNSAEKGKLLELITQKIFNGFSEPVDIKNSSSKIKEKVDCAMETLEDAYIKEVILGQSNSNTSRNSVGSNIYNPGRDIKNKTGLRIIVIDGSNVAMEHGKGQIFSVKGLQICIDYFVRRGHVVKAFVPRFRCKFGKSSNPRLLDDYEKRGFVVYTPSREVQGKMINSYDDRYIVQCAAEFDGVIVSGDNYRDLMRENPRWKYVIENRLLPFTWVHDMIMFPKDPLGRYGPTLEQFLRHPNPKRTKSKTKRL